MARVNKRKAKKMFVEALKSSKGIVSLACEIVGVSRTTYYNWLKEDELFKNSCEEIQEYVIDVVESKLLANINNNDTTAIIFYLKSKAKSRGYVEKMEHDVSVNPFMELMQAATATDGK